MIEGRPKPCWASSRDRGQIEDEARGPSDTESIALRIGGVEEWWDAAGDVVVEPDEASTRSYRFRDGSRIWQQADGWAAF